MYKYDIHVHTSQSSMCGKVDARDTVAMYKGAGYQGVVITDHYHSGFFDRFPHLAWEEKVDVYLEGFEKASGAGKEMGLDVFLGMEITFMPIPNDFLIFGINRDMLLSNPKLYELGFEGFTEFARANGLLIYQAHPFRKNQYVERVELMDGIEVYNGNPRHDSNNCLAAEYVRNTGTKGISGSDFHRVEDLARGGIGVDRRIKNMDDLKHILKNNEYRLLYGDD